MLANIIDGAAEVPQVLNHLRLVVIAFCSSWLETPHTRYSVLNISLARNSSHARSSRNTLRPFHFLRIACDSEGAGFAPTVELFAVASTIENLSPLGNRIEGVRDNSNVRANDSTVHRIF